MLVLGKRKPPGSAAAYRAAPQEAGFADNAQAFPSLTRPSRPHREMAAVLLAGPIPPRAGDSRGTKSAWRPQNPFAEDNMLSVTESADRITVKCSCGCYSLTAHKPAEPYDGPIRCLICGARAGLAELLADWRLRRIQRSDMK